MVSLPRMMNRQGPIGLDLGTRSVKLIQFSADRSRVIDAVRWDMPSDYDVGDDEDGGEVPLIEAIRHARDGRRFVGTDVVMSLQPNEMSVFNIRVPKNEPNPRSLIEREATARLGVPHTQLELRHVEAGEVRQGNEVARELIVYATERTRLTAAIERVLAAGLNPVCVDVPPHAILRGYFAQCRREEDTRQRVAYVHVGHASAATVLAEGSHPLFVKYVDVGGQHFDEAVARRLEMGVAEAAALRRHNGDRRADQRDPEISRGVSAASRPVIEKLASELAMCMRYYSVTFRGQRLARLVLGGGEANSTLVEAMQKRLDVPCELGDPLRNYKTRLELGRGGQWDIAAGLALRDAPKR